MPNLLQRACYMCCMMHGLRRVRVQTPRSRYFRYRTPWYDEYSG